MGAANIESELVGLERKYWQAMKDQDVAAAVEMTADPCLVTGAQGVGQIGRRDFQQMMRNARWKLHDFELKDLKVQLLSPDVAVLAYRVHEELTVDGQRLTLDASDASTWVRRDGRWLCALHTESITGDPYGRDRKA